MRKTIGALIVGLILLSSNLAFGFVLETGNDLLPMCNAAINYVYNNEASGDVSKMGYCLGMLQGVLNLNSLYRIEFGNKALFCLPSKAITGGQAARMVVKYLKEHPERLHEKYIILVGAALREAFPCK